MAGKRINFHEWANEYEATARQMSSLAYDYREKAKEARTSSRRGELTEKAHMYEMLCREKLREARIIRERALRGEGPNLTDESDNKYEFINRDL